MSDTILSILAKGVCAGFTAASVQVMVGKAEDILFLPLGEDADLAPRLVERLGGQSGHDPSETEKWTLGTVFHHGYGALWGPHTPRHASDTQYTLCSEEPLLAASFTPSRSLGGAEL